MQLLLIGLDLQLDVLRLGRLVEADGRAALVVAAVRALAREEGDDLVRAASALGISTDTARTQLKAVFAKTETHRQSELVLLASRVRTPG